MLEEIDVAGVILGHSERRQFFGETDKALQAKVPRALEAGLIPILCVGETEEERERGETERKLRHQVQEGLDKVPLERLHEVVVAYEPIWAIGTGLTATPEQAQDAIAFVRALVQGFDKEAGNQVRVLYGGSMKADNAAELLAQPDVDGGLIGGASLDRRRAVRGDRGGRAREHRELARAPSRRRPRSCSTAGAWRDPGPATRSRWRRPRSSTSCGRSTRTRR